MQIRLVCMQAGRLNFMVPLISSDKRFAYEYLTTCENYKHNISLSRHLFLCCLAEEPVLYSLLELVQVLNSLNGLLLSHLGVDQPKRKKRLILRPLPLPNPKGHVANAFQKEREITANVLSGYFVLTVRMPTHTCANTHLHLKEESFKMRLLLTTV